MIYLLFLVLPFSHSFWEEYSYFSESDLELSTDIGRLGTEYYSDRLTFQYPMDVHGAFLKANQVYDLSIGSISGEAFYTRHRLKSRIEMSEDWAFQVAYWEESDFERERQHFNLELQRNLSESFSAFVFTEIPAAKKDIDLGAGLNYHFSPAHTLRLYGARIDYAFNSRNEGENVEDVKDPWQLGFVGRWLSKESGDFVEYYAHVQTPLQRFNTDLNTTTFFRENRYGLRGSLFLEDLSSQLHWNVAYAHREEGESGEATNISENRIYRTGHLVDTLLQLENRHWLYGVQFVARLWERGLLEKNHYQALPHVYYKSYKKDRERWRLGYEVSAPWEDSTRVEHRANLRWAIPFSDGVSLYLNLTGDLDDFSWEGGHGLLQIPF